MVKVSGTRKLLFKSSPLLSACVTLGKSLDTVGPRYFHTENTGWQTAHVSMSELLLYSWTGLDRICEAFGTKQVLCLLCDSKKTNRFRNWKEKSLSFLCSRRLNWEGENTRKALG